MILSFRHRGLERYFRNPRYTDKRGIDGRMARRLIYVLDALDVIEHPGEMDLAGLYFHPLKGNRKGWYSVRVTGNWRIIWRMRGNDVVDVDLEDYH